MSMTWEEPIVNLEKLIALFHTASEQSKMVDCSKIIETLEFAATALRPVSREQVEKVCGKWIIPTVIGGRAFNIPHCSVCNGVPCGTDENTKFCAHCGAPMTDEAVEMVMERMEALHDTEN